MRSIFITNIIYDFNNSSIDPYTLPSDMIFVVDNNFNKYTEVYQLVKERIGVPPKSYYIKDIKRNVFIQT